MYRWLINSSIVRTITRLKTFIAFDSDRRWHQKIDKTKKLQIVEKTEN